MTSGLFRTRCRFMPRRRFYRLGLGNGDGRLGLAQGRNAATPALHSQPKLLGNVIIDRTGVGFLLGDAELGQHVDDFVGGNLQLPCQLVDANFTHK